MQARAPPANRAPSTFVDVEAHLSTEKAMNGRLNRIRAFLSASAGLVLLTTGSQAGAAALTLFVDCSLPAGSGTGSAQQPFSSIGAAVDAGRPLVGTYGPIKISIAPGTCNVSNPIVVDYSVRIQGSSVLDFDQSGRPVGTVQSNTDTRVVAGAGLGTNAVFTVQPAVGAATVRVVYVSNLSIIGAEGATAAPAAMITVQKAQAVTVSDLVIRGAAAGVVPGAGIDLSASTGYVQRSYVKGASACGICITGGSAVSPAAMVVTQNRAMGNGAGGLLLAGTGANGGATLTVQVNNNAFSDNSTGKQGFGIRAMAIGTAIVDAPNTGTVTAQITNNEMARNRYGMIIDAGWPPRNNLTGTACLDNSAYVGKLTLSLSGNTGPAQTSTEAPALLTTTRAQVWLNNQKLVRWQYLHNSTIIISDPSLTLSNGSNPSPFPHDAPLTDAFLNGGTDGGACSGDYRQEALGNTVIYNSSFLQGENL